MYQINFIKGKGLITKNVDDFVVSAYFEISTQLYEIIHKYLNKILQLKVNVGSESYTYDCNIDDSVKNYITYCGDHGVIRLDIHLKNLTNLILVGNIIAGDLFLII